MPPTLNIAALARRTGVAPDTIRKWEQRYGVLRPERTSGGQRRYSERDLARVEWLKARLADGYRIGEAAALLGAGAAAEAPETPEELCAALTAAADRCDAPSLGRFIEQTLFLNELEDALARVIGPTLKSVGDRWAKGELTVAQEHLVTTVVRTHLEKLLADLPRGVRGTTVLACAPGERHDLGLLMLAVLLQADGWGVAFLGADTPLADAVALARCTSARALCVSMTMPESARHLRDDVSATTLPQDLALVVGGPAFSDCEPGEIGARTVGAELAQSVDALRLLAG
jgi:DNA-binding transcriptional MerR regulator